MQKRNSAYLPPAASLLKIEVRRNDAGDTFETALHCRRNGCGGAVVIDSSGPNTIQKVSCLKHGLLTTFPDKTALGEFVRISANEILARNGHELIEAGAVSIFGDEQQSSDLMN